jgi:hypothetical protein
MRFRILLGAFLLLSLTSCNYFAGTVDQNESINQEALLNEGSKQAGLPGITHFSERKILKALYELRDAQHSTYTYTQSLDGKFHFLCNSIGYPIPYSAQLTNPSKVTYSPGSTTPIVISQAEPNGLFTPSHSEATWVMCAAKGALSPVYVEQRVITSPQKMLATGEIDDKSAPTITIPSQKK